MRGTVYLAGPITHAGSYDKATCWRHEADQALFDLGIRALSPMRDHEFLAGNWNRMQSDGSYEHPLTLPSGIVGRDSFDVKRCDVMLVNLLDAKRVSIGTMIEYGWASAMGKVIITVMREDSIHDHAMLKELSTYIVDDIEEGIALCDSVIG